MTADDTKQIISTATGGETESNPHKQLIETICNDVLPNMVRLYDSKKMSSALDRDQFEKIIEQKIERANKSLKVLPVEEQYIYRAKIDQAYAENIDRLNGTPEWKNPVFETKWQSSHTRHCSSYAHRDEGKLGL
jgi:hypothetical protein